MNLSVEHVPQGVSVEVGRYGDWDPVDGTCKAFLHVDLHDACLPFDGTFDVVCSLMPEQGESVSVRATVALQVSCPSEGVVFSNKPPGEDREVWVINPDGSDPRQLTDNTSEDDDPAWSPDRSQIAFVSTRDGGLYFALFLMNADGSNPVKKAEFSGIQASTRQPAWSPDGSRIALSVADGFGSDIWIVDVTSDPATTLQLTFQPTDPRVHNEDVSPTWSDNGSDVLFVRVAEGRVYSVPAAGGAPAAVSADDPDGPILNIDAGPAGIACSYYSFLDSVGRLKLLTANSKITSGGTHALDEWPSWAPTNDSVVFMREEEAESRLFIVVVDGVGPHGAEEIPNQPAGSNEHPDWGLPSR